MVKMKSILVVCDQVDIDVPLRKSLGHLVNSCQLRVTSNGYQAFDELALTTFDLMVVDSEITGIDSLELVESVDYIDPGIPVIVMLHPAHQLLWGPARMLKANPILRPFKPLTFLRLVDTLLHEYLERYRDLAETLKTILTSLGQATEATVTFLVDGSGSPLISTGQLDDDVLRALGAEAIGSLAGNVSPATPRSRFLADNELKKDHELYLTTALENLYLGLISPASATQPAATGVWDEIDLKAAEVARAFYENATFATSQTFGREEWVRGGDNPDKDPQQDHRVVPLTLTPATADVEPSPQAEETDQDSINWQIIPF